MHKLIYKLFHSALVNIPAFARSLQWDIDHFDRERRNRVFPRLSRKLDRGFDRMNELRIPDRIRRLIG